MWFFIISPWPWHLQTAKSTTKKHKPTAAKMCWEEGYHSAGFCYYANLISFFLQVTHCIMKQLQKLILMNYRCTMKNKIVYSEKLHDLSYLQDEVKEFIQSPKQPNMTYFSEIEQSTQTFSIKFYQFEKYPDLMQRWKFWVKTKHSFVFLFFLKWYSKKHQNNKCSMTLLNKMLTKTIVAIVFLMSSFISYW